MQRSGPVFPSKYPFCSLTSYEYQAEGAESEREDRHGARSRSRRGPMETALDVNRVCVRFVVVC